MRSISRRQFLRDGAATAAGVGLGLGARSLLMPARSLAQAGPEPAALEDLRTRLSGTRFVPGDSGYVAAYRPANGRYWDIAPAGVARVADEADVVTCVAWCVENGVSPVVRAGGHSYAGFCTNEELIIDIRRLNRLDIDRANATAVAGGAALNNDFFIATEGGPLFLPGGTCLGVGIGGLTLGGGIGYNAHWAGLTSDHLQGTRMVLASGEVRDVDATHDPDLLWACRGGAGGSFGINTEFTFDLVEAPDTITWYRFTYRGADDATAVLSAFDAILQTAPPALNAVAMAQATPVGDGGPREAIDVMTRGQYVGPIDELRDLLAPLMAVATPVDQTLAEMPFWQAQRMIASTEGAPHAWGDVSRYAKAPIPEAVTVQLVDLITECPSRSDDANGSIWSLGWVGGDKMNSVGRTETAYVHRGMTTLLRPTTVWPIDADPAVGADLNAWTASVIETLEPVTPHESYQNFPNRDIEDWAVQYYAENLERLIDVKTAVDPGDVFHNEQSIPPRS